MDLSYIAVLLLLGLGGGFFAGLLGIGGGMVLVPFFTMVFTWQNMSPDLVVHASIATAMATILFTSISSTLAHHRRGAVLWRVTLMIVPGLVVGGLLAGGAVFSLVPTSWLALVFGLFVGYSALGMFRSRPPKASGRLPGPLGVGAVGAGIGFASGLVGAGGGFLTVPFLSRCNVPLHQAIATSASLGFPIALTNTVGYIYSGWDVARGEAGMLGYVMWPALLVVALGSIFMAPRGAALAHSLPVARLRQVFALILLSLACYMLWKSYTAFAGY